MTITEFQPQYHRMLQHESLVVDTDTVPEQKRNPDDAQFIVRTLSVRNLNYQQEKQSTDDARFIVRTSSGGTTWHEKSYERLTMLTMKPDFFVTPNK